MGDEDTVSMSMHSKTTQCVSQDGGECLVITLTDFLQRVKFNEETWSLIKETAEKKQ